MSGFGLETYTFPDRKEGELRVVWPVKISCAHLLGIYQRCDRRLVIVCLKKGEHVPCAEG